MHVGYIWTAWAIVGLVMVLESEIAPWWAWLLWLLVVGLLVPRNETKVRPRKPKGRDQ